MNARIRLASSASPAFLIILAGTTLASPAYDVRSTSGGGPILPGNAPAGPAIDPTTANGQWFLMNNGLEDSRSHEFHDNISSFNGQNWGGGPVSGFGSDHLAVQGTFAGYVTQTNGVVGYQMQVRITNNTPAVNGTGLAAPNSHGENRLVPWPTYAGTMHDVRFSAHWADDGNALNYILGGPNGASDNPPTSFPVSPGTSNTYATGYDALAWYSYTNPQPGAPQGSYQVPTWDFGTIPVGATATRLLTFSFYEAVNPALLPAPSVFQGHDMLTARSDDIKIGTYFQSDPIVNAFTDRYFPYPGGSFNPATAQYANSSVFFSDVPAPGAATVLGLAGFMAARRRR
jgi:hypothetical protein